MSCLAQIQECFGSFAIARMVCWGKKMPFLLCLLHCPLLPCPQHGSVSSCCLLPSPCLHLCRLQHPLRCLQVGFAPPQHEGAGHCNHSWDLVQALVQYIDASHEPLLCLQRGEGNLLSPRLKLPLHAWGLSLTEKKGTNPVGFNISIIPPRLILIFSFDSFVVFISRDFCHVPSILQCA